MVIGRVLPETLSSSTSNNALSESTSNNILKTMNVNPNISNSNNNKYSSRLQTISPIKLTNSIDSNGSDEETTNATTIHISNHNNDNKNNNSNSRSNLLNIFTPNTATTAVDSNYSNSNKSDNKKSAINIHKQEMKLKKLRKFTENSKLVEEDILKDNTVLSENDPPYSAQEINTDYFHLDEANMHDYKEYYTDEDEIKDGNYFEEDIQRFNRNKGLSFAPVEKRRLPISKKKSIGMNLNNKQQLRFVDNNVYEEVDDDDEFDSDFQNYAFLVEQHERLLYEQQQLKIQQEKVKQLSRSTSLRNLQHNMRTSIKADSPVKQQRVLSRSSSRNTLNSYLPQQQQQQQHQQQLMGHRPILSNAKSMMNLRSSFNHRKSVSTNHHNIVYEEDDLLEDIEPVYSNPTPNHLYSQQRNPMPKFKSMNNLRIASLREENHGPSRKQAAYLRPRVSSSSLYQPTLEEDALEYENNYGYNYEYDYEHEFMDDTFQQDFQSQHIPYSQPWQQQDERRIVDYWSLPQETNTKPFKRNQRLQYELQPLRGNPVSKLDQLRSFREQQQQQTTQHKPNKVKQLKIIPKQAAKYKDGDKSGIMTYDAVEKRWVGNASILEDLEYLPDAGKYQQISQLPPPKLSYGVNAKRHGMSRSMSYHNFNNELPKQINIDIDTHFPSNVLAEWYSFEVGLDKKIGHWLSMRDGEGDVNDWEIYDLVLGSNN